VRLLGVDTGLHHTGLASIITAPMSEPTATAEAHDVPEGPWLLRSQAHAEKLARLVANFQPDLVCVESQAFSRGGIGPSIGILHGFILRTITAARVPILYVPPTKWKYGVMGPGKHEKSEAVQTAHSLYAGQLQTFDHNAAEALLLAHTGRRFLEIVTAASEPTDLESRIFLEPLPRDKPAGVVHREGEFFWCPTDTPAGTQLRALIEAAATNASNRKRGRHG
jgi:Holliday junction resolvasome RuvABC endonuclease subunit